MDVSSIPFSKPSITDAEIDAVTTLLRSGDLSANEGNFRAAKDALRQLTGASHILLTTSCTKALELTLSCLQLTKEDEVLLPSYTFVSTATAVLAVGGTPRFIEIEDQTLNIDPDALKNAISEKTRVLLPVHYAGVSCDMDALMTIAREKNLHVVEDAAHAIGATYKGKALGAIGDFGCYSFHDTKNIVSGEGGAVLVNTPAYADIADICYEKGTDRSKFLRGEIDKYTWVSEGSSYAMAGPLAALLAAQLSRIEEIKQARKNIVEYYESALAPLAAEGHLRFPVRPSFNESSYHLAYFLLKEPERRPALFEHLKRQGISATFHYVPLHSSPYALQHLGTRQGQLPVTERVAASIVRLPLYPDLTSVDLGRIADAVHTFFHPEHSAKMPDTTVKKDVVSSYDLTLIVPCYNEEDHLHESLDALVETLSQMKVRYEILLIDDKSTDRTPERIQEYLSAHPQLPVRAIFHRENIGRGATVTEGVTLARGALTGFIDIDLEIPARYVPTMLAPLRRGEADLVVADRTYKLQFSALQRYFMSVGFRSLVRMFLSTPSLDTEAGCKFFRRDRMLPILEQTKDRHWFWDTEMTVRAFDAGLRVKSEPVLFLRKPDKKSTVRLFRDSIRSLKSLFAFSRKRTSVKANKASEAHSPV